MEEKEPVKSSEDFRKIDQSEVAEGTEMDMFYALEVVFRYRYFIVGFTFIVGVLSIIYVLVATPLYKSDVTMYPVAKYQSSPLGELARGFGLPNKIEGFHIPEVIKSKQIAKSIILKKYKTEQYPDSVNLIQYWKLDEIHKDEVFAMEAATKAFENIMTIKDDKETLLITISIYMPESQLAADVANYIGVAVTDYLQSEQKKTTKASRIYLEERLNYAINRLEEAEKNLITFKSENTLTTSPALRSELLRLERSLKLASDFATMLEKQRELMSIEEVKEKPIVSILDTAEKTRKPLKPQKRQVVITNTFFGFFLSIVMAFLKEKYYTNENIRKVAAIIRKEKKK
ncbi:MAG: hypothetical protein JXR90_13830 [Spirochaetes bacterium]|nr:hypothetical protein [Spirochaetota bacterium]